MNQPPPDQRKFWLDDPRNVDKVWYALLAICAVLFVADAFYHKHVHFGVESWFGFYGIYGFVACVFLVLAARGLRRLLMRPENYYDNPDD